MPAPRRIRLQEGTWSHPRCESCGKDLKSAIYVDDERTERWLIRSRSCQGTLVDFHAGLQKLDKLG